VRHHEIEKRVASIMAGTPRGGSASLPFLGTVACVMGHRLRAVSLPCSACVLVLRGRKTVFLGSESMVAREGDMFLLPAQCEVSIENVPDPAEGRYLALCLSFGADMVARVAAGLDTGEPLGGFSLDSLRVVFDVPLLASLGHLLDMAAFCPGEERLLGLSLEAFLTLAAARTSCMPALSRAEASWRTRLARLVLADPSRDWSVAGMAARLGVSERTLRRNLHAERTAFREVLRDVRLGAALAQLQAGRSNVAEVALGCGYGSPSRFAVLFRERFGVRPSDIGRFMAGNGQHLAGLERTGMGAAG
jgi:AraC-like DNA-binding protein